MRPIPRMSHICPKSRHSPLEAPTLSLLGPSERFIYKLVSKPSAKFKFDFTDSSPDAQTDIQALKNGVRVQTHIERISENYGWVQGVHIAREKVDVFMEIVLMRAVTGEHLPLVRWVIQEQIHSQNFEGKIQSALGMAAMYDRLLALKLLMEYVRKFDFRMETVDFIDMAMQRAAYEGSLRSLILLKIQRVEHSFVPSEVLIHLIRDAARSPKDTSDIIRVIIRWWTRGKRSESETYQFHFKAFAHLAYAINSANRKNRSQALLLRMLTPRREVIAAISRVCKYISTLSCARSRELQSLGTSLKSRS